MRITLSIDDDVLAAAKNLAARQHKGVGEVISVLARQTLRPERAEAKTRNGVPLLQPHAGVVVTPELVNRLREELP